MLSYWVGDLKHKITAKNLKETNFKNINSTLEHNHSLNSRYKSTKVRNRVNMIEPVVKKSTVLCSTNQWLSKDCENILKQENNINSIIKPKINQRIAKNRYSSQPRIFTERLHSRSDKKSNLLI